MFHHAFCNVTLHLDRVVRANYRRAKGELTEKKKRVVSVLYFWFQTNEEVTRELEAQPTAGHTGSDLEKVGSNTLIQPLDTFVLDDDSDGVED